MAGARDWIIALASLIAAVGAVVAAFPAVRAYRQGIRDRHREHASKLSVWVVPSHFEAGPGSLRGRMPTGWGANVRNSSDEPMYRVIVVFRDGESPTEVLATGDTLDVLPPGETRAVSGHGIPSRPGMPGVLAEALFTDRAGVRWYRDWQGGLTEHPHLTLGTTTLDDPGSTLS